jgi:hypothetical protein
MGKYLVEKMFFCLFNSLLKGGEVQHLIEYFYKQNALRRHLLPRRAAGTPPVGQGLHGCALCPTEDFCSF